jgi:hypothetical protein
MAVVTVSVTWHSTAVGACHLPVSSFFLPPPRDRLHADGLSMMLDASCQLVTAGGLHGVRVPWPEQPASWSKEDISGKNKKKREKNLINAWALAFFVLCQQGMISVAPAEIDVFGGGGGPRLATCMPRLWCAAKKLLQLAVDYWQSTTRACPPRRSF